MNRTEVTHVVNAINNAFTSPFLPVDFVEARVMDDGGLSLKIGARDVRVRDDGTFMAQGTDLTKEWSVVGHKDNHGISFEMYKVLYALLNCFEPGQYAKPGRQQNCMEWGRKVLKKARRLGLHEAPL